MVEILTSHNIYIEHVIAGRQMRQIDSTAFYKNYDGDSCHKDGGCISTYKTAAICQTSKRKCEFILLCI